MASTSVSMTWRPSRSASVSGRMSPTPMGPPNSSVMGGSTRISRSAWLPRSHSSRSSSELAPGMARMTRRRVVVGGRLGEVAATADHPHAAEAQVPLGRIVVDHRHRQVRALRVAEHGGDGLHAALAGAEHERAAHAVAARTQLAFECQPPGVARTAHGDEGDDPAGDGHAGRYEQGVVELVDGGERGGGDGHRLDEVGDLVERAELPAPEVEAEAQAGDGLAAPRRR